MSQQKGTAELTSITQWQVGGWVLGGGAVAAGGGGPPGGGGGVVGGGGCVHSDRFWPRCTAGM